MTKFKSASGAMSNPSSEHAGGFGTLGPLSYLLKGYLTLEKKFLDLNFFENFLTFFFSNFLKFLN